MGWLGDFLRKVAGAQPTEYTFLESVPAAGVPGIGEPLVEDECYVEVYVESLRLSRARRFATRFNGVVYTFVTLARQGEANAQFASVSKPEKLSELDKDSLDRVITVSKQMMGAVPWRGGTLSLEVGLFSIKAGNILTPILDYVTKVSATAGISFVGAVRPFLPLITEGLDLIAGQQQDTALEVAIDTDQSPTAGVVMAIIDAPKGSIDRSAVTLDPADRKLLVNGQPLAHGYCVVSLRRVLQKADFGEIPELKEKYAALQVAIRGNRVNDARDALTAFRLATIASPDLIPSDARKLVAKAEQKLQEAFPGGAAPAIERSPMPEPLSAIGLYR